MKRPERKEYVVAYKELSDNELTSDLKTTLDYLKKIGEELEAKGFWDISLAPDFTYGEIYLEYKRKETQEEYEDRVRKWEFQQELKEEKRRLKQKKAQRKIEALKEQIRKLQNE